MSSHGRGGFQASKCKTQLRMGTSRMKRFCNKKLDFVVDTGREVAGLLKNGDESSARLRVEEIIREKNVIEAYELLTACAERVSSQMYNIDSQETCPSDIKDDISTLLYASSKRTELVDFSQLHSMFVDKYGEEFVTTAIELRHGCGVDVKVVERLLANPVTEVAKLKVMQEIAADHNVEWNPAAGQGSSATVSAHPNEDYQSNSTGISDLGGEAPVADPLRRIQSRQEDRRAGSVTGSGQSRAPPLANPREGIQLSSEERRTDSVSSRVPSTVAPPHNPPEKAQARPGSMGSSDLSRYSPPDNCSEGTQSNSEELQTDFVSSGDLSKVAAVVNPPGRMEARPGSAGSSAPSREPPVANPPRRMEARPGSAGSSVPSREPPQANPPRRTEARPGAVGSSVPNREPPQANPPRRTEARPGAVGSSAPNREPPRANPPRRTELTLGSVDGSAPDRGAPPANPSGKMQARPGSVGGSVPDRETSHSNSPGRVQARPGSVGVSVPGREISHANSPKQMQVKSEDSFGDGIRVDSNSRKTQGESSRNPTRKSEIFPASSMHQLEDSSTRNSGGMFGKISSWDQTGSLDHVRGESSLNDHKRVGHMEDLGGEGKGTPRSKANIPSDRSYDEDDWSVNTKTTSRPDESHKKPTENHEGSGCDSSSRKPVSASQKAHSVRGSEGSDRRVGVVGKSEAKVDKLRRAASHLEHWPSESGDEVDGRDHNRKIANGPSHSHKTKKSTTPSSDHDDYPRKGQVGDDLGYSEVPRNNRDPTSTRNRRERDKTGQSADDLMYPEDNRNQLDLHSVRQGVESSAFDKRQSFPMASVKRDKYSATRHGDELFDSPRTGRPSGRPVKVQPDEDLSDKSQRPQKHNSSVDRFGKQQDLSSSDDDKPQAKPRLKPPNMDDLLRMFGKK